MKIPLHKNCTKGPSINDVRSGVGKSLYECLVYVNIDQGIHKGKHLTSFMDAPLGSIFHFFNIHLYLIWHSMSYVVESF